MPGDSSAENSGFSSGKVDRNGNVRAVFVRSLTDLWYTRPKLGMCVIPIIAHGYEL